MLHHRPAGDDLAALEAEHRQHAQVEDRVRRSRRLAQRTFPSTLRAKRAWLELELCAHDLTVWTQELTLEGEHRACEPKRLRYRILYVAGHRTRHARRSTLHLPADWPWAVAIMRALKRVEALPAYR